MSQPDQEDDLALVSRTLGGLPIINQVMDRLGLPALLAGVLPAEDARQKLAPSAAIGVVVANLVLGREPLYGLGEWAARYDPALLGLTESEVDATRHPSRSTATIGQRAVPSVAANPPPRSRGSQRATAPETRSFYPVAAMMVPSGYAVSPRFATHFLAHHRHPAIGLASSSLARSRWRW